MSHTPSPARQGWADLLRCLACVAVVVLHATGQPLSTVAVNTPAWAALAAVSSLTRWSVPVFVMLSGAFLLDPARPFSPQRWRSRLVRLAAVTALAALVYALWDARTAHGWAVQLGEALSRLARGEFHYHLWFLPMLLGLYLLLPILRALVQGARRRTLWYAAALWAVLGLTLPFFYRLLPDAAGRGWLERLEPYAAFGYTGYFLLGYLLRTCALDAKRVGRAAAAGCGALAVTVAGTLVLSRGQGALNAAFLSYFSPFTACVAGAVFLAARWLDGGRHPVWTRLAELSLWVYLLHPLVLEVLF